MAIRDKGLIDVPIWRWRRVTISQSVLMYSGKYLRTIRIRLLSFTTRLLLIVSRQLIYTFTDPHITAVWCFPLVSSWFDNVVKFTLSFLAPLLLLNHALSPCTISAVVKYNTYAHNEVITIFLWRKWETCCSRLCYRGPVRRTEILRKKDFD